MGLNFEKYAQDANAFMKRLAEELGHPDEPRRAEIVVRAVLHTLRDRITVPESLNFMAQLPMFLKAVYVDEWKYRERPERLKNLEEFAEKVKAHQSHYGEQQFDWPEHTGDLIEKTLAFIQKNYLTKGEVEDIKAQLPRELEHIFG